MGWGPTEAEGLRLRGPRLRRGQLLGPRPSAPPRPPGQAPSKRVDMRRGVPLKASAPPLLPARAFDWCISLGAELGEEPGLVRGRSLRRAGPRPLCSCGGGRRCGLEVRAREPRRGERVAPGLSAGSAPPPDGPRGRAGPAPGVLRRPRVSPPPAAREHVTSSRRSLRPQRPRPRL